MTANTAVTLSAYLSESYAKQKEILTPQHAKLAKMLDFQQSAKTGNLYHQPVALSREHGAVFNTDGTAFSLSDPGPIATNHGDAQIQGSEIVIPTQLSYGAASRASGGVKQFIQTTRHLFDLNRDGMGFHLDLSLLYGQTGIAATSAVTASGTTGTFTVTQASWAAGIWFGAENMRLDLFTNIGDANPINTNAAVVVTSVNMSTRVVSFSCNTGDVSALNSASTSTVFRRRGNAGSNSFRECAGLDKIMTNTGTLFNISAATNALWQAQSKSAGSAPLTMRTIQEAVALVTDAGLKQDATLVCNPRTWANVMSDLSAARMFDSSYVSRGSLKNGSTEVEFYSQNGAVRLVPHSLCKEGEAFLFAPKHYVRVGSSDVTYRLPGMAIEQLVLHLPTNAGYEFRSYTDQAVFTAYPARSCKITNITNA